MQQLRKRIIAIVSIMVLLILFIIVKKSFGTPNIPYSKTGFYFDTYVSITIYGSKAEKKEIENLLTTCFYKCDYYESKFSKTKKGSDINKINNAKGDWVVVSDDTTNLLYTALNYCNFTDGKIDITISSAKDLWDFSENSSCEIPAPEELSYALTHVDYQKIKIQGNKVCLKDAYSSIDLGFIAKGYIADELKKYLLSKKVENALINLGGNVQTLGTRPDGTPFKIGIQKPFADLGTYMLAVQASEKDGYSSVVTSGIYERYFEKDGKIYHHILDATTGYPIDNNLASVTILTNSSVNADALSTACLILGLEDAKKLIEEQQGVDAIFITKENEIIDTRNQ